MNHYKKQKGFAMLFTVMIVTLMLSIGISISSLSFKQGILSNLAKDSQIAFYQADTAIECGLYYDINLNIFPLGTDPSSVTPVILCGDSEFSLQTQQSSIDYLVYAQNVTDTKKPCATILFDKLTRSGASVVQGKGYNVCASGIRQVERALEVAY